MEFRVCKDILFLSLVFTTLIWLNTLSTSAFECGKDNTATAAMASSWNGLRPAASLNLQISLQKLSVFFFSVQTLRWMVRHCWTILSIASGSLILSSLVREIVKATHRFLTFCSSSGARWSSAAFESKRKPRYGTGLMYPSRGPFKTSTFASGFRTLLLTDLMRLTKLSSSLRGSTCSPSNAFMANCTSPSTDFRKVLHTAWDRLIRCMGDSKLQGVTHTTDEDQIFKAILMFEHCMDPIIYPCHYRGIVSPYPKELLFNKRALF
ncbi:uncharacterized protein LOC124480697 [Hypomesus transpacificus]|uniref:uncharacterized protein LOC124480697 n=1 Tax=Hypomesus transpacificus TaxID=137520 RepID=UPI001F07A169|nr:uncharacterized protein LOC124480697 [Hypomesus transpacificus]XP_046896210.1 uncharacterized protein LOC124480697 [Hypomesus transpacificus]